MKTPAITQSGCAVDKPALAHKGNLDTLIRAAKAGDLTLMECTLNSTGEKVAAICAVNQTNGEYVFSPLGVMLNGNPYEMLTPPA